MNISNINFGTLSEDELNSLIRKATYHIEKRKQEPEKIIKIIRFEDGSEGSNVYLDRYKDIPAEDLKRQIWNWARNGGVHIEEVEVELESYLENEAQYNWIEEDQPKMDWEDDDADA